MNDVLSRGGSGRRFRRGGVPGVAAPLVFTLTPALALGLVSLLAGLLLPAAAAAMDTRVPSVSAGPGGKLAVRVTPAAFSRYPDGAPVVVLAPGGHEAGSLRVSEPVGPQGFVLVTFLFPGGVDSVFHSDGVYDYRGPNCQLALRDVLRFASGALADSAGRLIDDLAGMDTAEDNVGVLALSNGGSIGAVTLADHGAGLPGVRYLAAWESPTGPQTINADVGATRYDCDPAFDGDANGVLTDDAKNWAYAAYDTQSLALDYVHLAWDPLCLARYTDPAHRHPPVTVPGALFFDGNGNGSYDVRSGLPLDCPDLDGNGRLDPTEDYLLTGLAAYAPVVPGDSLRVFWSPPALAAARDLGLFGASWPAHAATPEQSAAYWNERDATRHYALLGAARPDLAALLLYRKGDHVQAEDDHAHVRQAYDGFLHHGLWCRLNPDSAYYAAVAGPLAGYVETPAGTVVAGPDMKAHAEPVSVNLALFTVAAVCEMADRVHYGVWDADLSAVIGATSVAQPEGPGTPDSPVQADGAIALLAVRPSPAAAEVALAFHLARSGFARLEIVDARGRRVRTLLAAGAHAGAQSVAWDGRDDAGAAAPAGLYFARLEAAGEVRTAKITLLR